MKKYLLFVAVFFIAAAVVFSQGALSPVSQMDNSIKELANNLNRKLIEEKAQSVIIGQFVYSDSISSLGTYWINQLTQELANLTGRPYAILSTGASADWTISGEIIDAAGTIRVYSRMVSSANRAIGAVFNTDFPREEHIVQMLNTGRSSGGGSSSSSSARDANEPDSMENPVTVTIGTDESNAVVLNRTIHDGNDEDFFALVPGQDGRLVVETTGSMDTYMYLYNAETRAELASNDDGGSGTNARIRHNVQAGQRYIARVKGYSSSHTGSYGFRAYIQGQSRQTPDEYEPNDEPSQAKAIGIGTPQQHTFHNGDDVDWVKFEVTQAGRYTIRARGVNSNRLDTYIELFDSNVRSIADDDDGGESFDSRLSRRLDAGQYYLKVSCLDDEPDQPYTISVTAE
jgi:hypothetical protein